LAKWYSSLFSDIRNKLANQIVFASWKGRGYFRQWVIPTNPKTNPQRAVREQMKNIVKLFQTYVDTETKKSAWDAVALPKLISGFNLMVQEGKKSAIECPSTGTTTTPVTITYTVGFDPAHAKVYAFDGTTLTDITPAGGLSSTPNSTFQHTFSATGTYTLYIADDRPLVSGDTAPQLYQVVTNCKADKTNGTAPIAQITIS